MSTPDKTHFAFFDEITRMLNLLPEDERAAAFELLREFTHDMRTTTGLVDSAQKLLVREVAGWEGAEGVADLFEIMQSNAQRADKIIEDLRSTVGDGIDLPQ